MYLFSDIRHSLITLIRREYARRAILLKWKGAVLPMLNQWHHDVMSFLTLEMLHFSMSDTKKKFYETWEPFLTYFHNTKCNS